MGYNTLEKLIEKNLISIPFEGKELDISGMKDTIKDLLKGMITFSQSFTKTDKGYFKNGKYYSRDEIVNLFIESIKL